VEAIKKHQYEKARILFYKAYLVDPDDPFTLNNLGYVAELDGQVERAHKFYSLASQLATEATIDRASARRVEGKPVSAVLGSAQDLAMQVNRINVEAVRLLGEGRAPEADLVLQQGLTMDRLSPFTLNNMGVAKEAEGDYDEALKYYSAAAGVGSSDPVVVTLSSHWKGKPINEMAAANAKKINEMLSAQESVGTRAYKLKMRGVAAINRNDWADARKFFQQAYALDPANPFSVNNLGYLAEMDGDSESADFYYQKARITEGASTPVGMATRRVAEGKRLSDVAGESTEKVETRITQELNARRREGGPVQLLRRDNQPVTEPGNAPGLSPGSQPQTAPQLGPPQPPVPQMQPNTQPPPPQPPDPTIPHGR
jgi:Flp pilus assembly protein TadD